MNKTIEKLKLLKPKQFKNHPDLGRELCNIYLEEFFNTNLDEVENSGLYEKTEEGIFTREASNLFFDTYKVTQEQCDWWEKEVRDLFKVKTRHSNYYLDRSLCFVFLQFAPSVKRD